MKTYMVNPLRATQTIRPGQIITGKTRQTRRRRNPPVPVLMAANPKRRRRRNAMLYAANPRYSANPLILPNRRKRRRNPFTPASSLREFAMVIGTGFAAGIVGYGADRILFQRLGVKTDDNGRVMTDEHGDPIDTTGGMLFRNGARLLGAGLGAYLFPSRFGSALTGALAYPIAGSLERWWRKSATETDQGATTTQDVLDDEFEELAADLEAELYD